MARGQKRGPGLPQKVYFKRKRMSAEDRAKADERKSNRSAFKEARRAYIRMFPKSVHALGNQGKKRAAFTLTKNLINSNITTAKGRRRIRGFFKDGIDQAEKYNIMVDNFKDKYKNKPRKAGRGTHPKQIKRAAQGLASYAQMYKRKPRKAAAVAAEGAVQA